MKRGRTLGAVEGRRTGQREALRTALVFGDRGEAQREVCGGGVMWEDKGAEGRSRAPKGAGR